MKKSSSVNLEESTWELINYYQKKSNLSSRNDAIEKMIIEWKMFWVFINSKNACPINPNDINMNFVNEEPPENKLVSDSIEDVYDNMPD